MARRFAPPDAGGFTRRASLETQVEYGLAPWKAKRLQRYIDENLGRGISNRALAALVDLSVSHLSRAFRTTFGDPPHAYVLRRRVERAKAMMLETGEALSQIAVLCGFADQAHFCRQFRRHTGLSPKRWMGRRLEPRSGTALR
ncbi:MAG: helix-turn-helix transcriptional regulator [Proteobacteria bacterium]|nr:helix-turn-helix transcriptional regulator [Pseudomonadota bacterium]